MKTTCIPAARAFAFAAVLPVLAPGVASAQIFSETWEAGSANWSAVANTGPIDLITDANQCSSTFQRETYLIGGGRVFSNASIAVTKGASYCATAWIRGSPGTCPFLGFTGHWVFGQSGYPNNFSGGTVVPVVSDNVWRWYKMPFVADVTPISFFHELWSACGAGSADFDDIQLWAGACPASPAGSPHAACGAGTACDTTLDQCVGPPGVPAIVSPANGAVSLTNTVVVTGTAAPASTVTIRDNGVAVASGQAALNGAFNITLNLASGSHPLTAVASNVAGASAASATLTVLVGPNPPIITAPAAGTTNSIATFTVSGLAVAGAAVKLYDNGVLVTTLTADGAGAFSYTFSNAALGGHSLTLTQTSNGLTSAPSAARTVVVNPDSDADGVYDGIDVCPALFNPDQVDRDGDGLGDVCDQAPAQVDGSNQTTSATDIAVTSKTSAETTMTASNQVNSVTLPQGAWAQQSTLTLVADPGNTGNVQLFGRPDALNSQWAVMQSYDLQLGPTHPAVLAGGQRAQVSVVVQRTTLAASAFRYRQLQARVRESDGSITTIPHCNNGMSPDGRCLTAATAYTNVNGTNVYAGIQLVFALKSL